MEIIKKVSTPITWKEVKELIEKGQHKAFFDVEDMIPATLKDGQQVTFVVAERKILQQFKSHESVC